MNISGSLSFIKNTYLKGETNIGFLILKQKHILCLQKNNLDFLIGDQQ